MLALRQNVEIIIGGIVAWCAVRTLMIATELFNWFQTGCPLILNLNEIIVAVYLVVCVVSILIQWL